MADKVSMSLDDIIKSDPKLKLRRGRGGKIGFSNRGVANNVKSGFLRKKGVSTRGRGGVTRGRGGVTRGRGGITRGKSGVTQGKGGVTKGKGLVTRGKSGVTRGRGGRGLTLAKQSVAKARAQLKIKKAKALLQVAVAEARSVSRQQAFNKGRALQTVSTESPHVQISYSNSPFSRGRGHQKRGKNVNVNDRYSVVPFSNRFSRGGRGRGQYSNKINVNAHYTARPNTVKQQRNLQAEYLNQARALIKAKKEVSMKSRGRGYARIQAQYVTEVSNYQAHNNFFNRIRRGGRGNRGGRGRMVYL